jgi:hypothetical protein
VDLAEEQYSHIKVVRAIAAPTGAAAAMPELALA